MPFFDPIRIGSSSAATGTTGYSIDRSIRISRDRGTYFTVSNSSSGNTQTFTFSFWLKLGKLFDNFLPIYSQYLTGSNRCGIVHTGTNVSSAGFQYQNRQSNSHKALIDPIEKIRDHSAWYHVVFRMDTTNSTQADRFIIYVNNKRIEFSSGSIFVVQNSTSNLNSTTTHYIGHDGYSGTGDFLLADVYLIDGQAYDPTYFAETNSTTGQWVPKAYSGSYSGTSYHLKFDDTTSVSALGTDSSGLGNNVTPNNFSLTAGVNYDSLTDTPTNNFCTLNPLDKASTVSLKNGNLQISDVSNQNYDGVRGTFGVKTGKYYWEIKFPNTGYLSAIGIARADGYIKTGSEPTYRIVLGLGSWYNSYNSGGVATYVNATPSGDYPSVATWSGASNYSTNDIYMIAVDFDTGKIWWGKNNSWFNNSGTANPATGTDPRITFTTGNEWFPYSQEGDSSSAAQAYNFGQQGFAYTPPTGFVALSSANLPDPAITDGTQHFNTKLWTGNGGTQTIDQLNFAPDWAWIKSRSSAINYQIIDTVRGATLRLQSNETTEEKTNTNGLSAFTSDGYTLGDQANVNGSGLSLVGWNWNAGDSDGKTYTVKVVSDSGNKYRFDDFGTSAVTLELAEGGTYIFDQSDSSNATHPLRFYTAADKSGGEYTTGVTTSGTAGSSGATVTITIAASAPTLYYQCSSHAGMGGQINTNSTLGSSNFDGSVQARVKANATAGFSIIIAEAPSSGTNFTVGHGLGVAPNVIFAKSRETAQYWAVFHSGTTDTNRKYLQLNSDIATTTSGGDMWGAALPTSSVIGLSSANAMVASEDFVCYCFSEVEGYSRFGTYTGNGDSSTGGVFVFTNFRPAVIILKRTNSAASWVIHDDKRAGYNGDNDYLHPDLAQAESDGSTGTLDILSNGFKLRMTAGTHNGSGDTFIYLAFAESPFKYSRGR